MSVLNEIIYNIASLFFSVKHLCHCRMCSSLWVVHSCTMWITSNSTARFVPATLKHKKFCTQVSNHLNLLLVLVSWGFKLFINPVKMYPVFLYVTSILKNYCFFGVQLLMMLNYLCRWRQSGTPRVSCSTKSSPAAFLDTWIISYQANTKNP